MFYGVSNKPLNNSFLICFYYSIKDSIRSCADVIFYSLIFYSLFIYSWIKKEKLPKLIITQQKFLVLFRVTIFHLPRRLEDVFKTCLQDVFLKRSWRPLGRQRNVTLRTSLKRLQDVFSTSSPRRMFARKLWSIKAIFTY